MTHSVPTRRSSDLLAGAWAAMRGHAAGASGIVEAIVEFRMEVSVIVARSADGSLRSYVPVENRHKNHILDETIAPANLPDELAGRAEATARHLAKEIGRTARRERVCQSGENPVGGVS